jgi:hypothetical protein
MQPDGEQYLHVVFGVSSCYAVVPSASSRGVCVHLGATSPLAVSIVQLAFFRQPDLLYLSSPRFSNKHSASNFGLLSAAPTYLINTVWNF